MLYHFLYPLHTSFSRLQRLPLHHLPDPAGGADGARLVRCSGRADPPADRAASGSRSAPTDRQRHQEGRHADHGRDAHPLLAAALDPAAGRPHQPLRLAGAAGDARLRPDRLRRRLPQGTGAATRRACGRGRSPGAVSRSPRVAAVLADAGAGFSPTVVMPFLKDVQLDLGWFYMPVRRCWCWSARRTRSTSPTASTGSPSARS